MSMRCAVTGTLVSIFVFAASAAYGQDKVALVGGPLIDGFGLIAFASVMPMIFVQAYGILAYQNTAVIPPVETEPNLLLHTGWLFYVELLLASIRDVLPVVTVIVVFYWFILKKKIENSITLK